MRPDILFRPARYLSHQRDVSLRINEVRFGVAGLLEAREPPEVRKVPALLEFYRLHGAIAAFKEQILAIRLSISESPGDRE